MTMSKSGEGRGSRITTLPLERTRAEAMEADVYSRRPMSYTSDGMYHDLFISDTMKIAYRHWLDYVGKRTDDDLIRIGMDDFRIRTLRESSVTVFHDFERNMHTNYPYGSDHEIGIPLQIRVCGRRTKVGLRMVSEEYNKNVDYLLRIFMAKGLDLCWDYYRTRAGKQSLANIPDPKDNPDVFCERCNKTHKKFTFTQQDYDKLISDNARIIADQIDAEVLAELMRYK